MARPRPAEMGAHPPNWPFVNMFTFGIVVSELGRSQRGAKLPLRRVRKPIPQRSLIAIPAAQPLAQAHWKL